eukprot:s3038_g8.t1
MFPDVFDWRVDEAEKVAIMLGRKAQVTKDRAAQAVRVAFTQRRQAEHGRRKNWSDFLVACSFFFCRFMFPDVFDWRVDEAEKVAIMLGRKAQVTKDMATVRVALTQRREKEAITAAERIGQGKGNDHK